MTNEEIIFINDMFKGAIVHYYDQARDSKHFFPSGKEGYIGLGDFYNAWIRSESTLVRLTKIELNDEIKKRLYEYLAKP